MRRRLLAPVLLVLALTAAGFFAARVLIERDAREEAQHRADIAATEVRGGIEQASSLVESLRRYLLGRGNAAVANEQFADIGARWLSPVGLQAAAWVEQVPPTGTGSSSLRATLVTGASPMTAPGIDLGDEPVLVGALADPRTLFRVTATPLTHISDGRTGIFLVQSAPRLSSVLVPGFAVLFVPGSWLLAEVTEEANPRLQLRIGDTTYGGLGGAAAVGSSFSAAGTRFDVLLPEEPLRGTAAALPWLVLGAGLVLAGLTGTLSAVAQRRGRAQREVDRIFTLSPDVITVADFDGYWKRVNPAFEALLGYSEREALSRPYLEFVHQDDRERTRTEVLRVAGGETTLSFENRLLCKDGTHRWIEWTATAVAEEGAFYGLARDVTERRQTAGEQAALRRIATLAAESAEPDALFAAVAEEVATVIDVPLVRVVRYETDGTASECASYAREGLEVPFGQRSSLEGTSVLSLVRESSSAARIDDYSGLEGEIAEIARRAGIRSAVGSPIVVAGRLWGAVVASSEEQLPEDTEARLADFTELLATAIAETQSREALRLLADEQAALRRVAVLVAQQPSPDEVFTAVTEAVAPLLGADLAAMHAFRGDGMATVLAGWSAVGPKLPIGTQLPLDGDTAVARIFHTAAPARVDDYADAKSRTADVARNLRLRSTVGAPILVEGKLWGALMAATRSDKPLPDDAERRIAAFTELVATAISNAQAREDLHLLADQQAALRRVATLVARGVPPEELFGAVAEDVGQLLPVTSSAMGRRDPDGLFTTVAAWSSTGATAFPVGGRWRPEGKNVTTLVLETGRSARLDDFSDASGPVGEVARQAGYRSAVGSPIMVEGRLWGVMTAASTAEEPLPIDTETRLASFTDLVGTAIANTESRAAIRRLAVQQAALRRVATVVAEAAPPAEVFSTISDEVNGLLDAQTSAIVRLEQDGTATIVVNRGTTADALPVGAQLSPQPGWVLTAVIETGQPSRKDDYADFEGAPEDMPAVIHALGIQSSVAAPIVVEGTLWGVIVVGREGSRFPDGTEQRLEDFTDLAATAVANAASRAALAVLADEQAALRRVATLVAQGVPPEEIFSAVSEEVGILFGTEQAAVGRFDREGSAIVLIGRDHTQERWELDGFLASAEVFRTGRSARADAEAWASADGAAAARLRELGVVSTVASPIVVEGRLWGAMLAASSAATLPADAETRLEKFTVLVANAIANAESRSEVAASRMRIVAASDEARRKIERNLHDGTQQRLVSLGLAVRAVGTNMPPERDDLQGELSRIAVELADAVEDLQEISRGIHPAVLSKRGLGSALRSLALRSAIPVEVEIATEERLPEPIEVALYYVVSESVTNATKHASASLVEVEVAQRDGNVHLSIRDDGVGGADQQRGSGLIGLRDRVEALGGTIDIASPVGAGTSVRVVLPLHGARRAAPSETTSGRSS